MKNYKIKIVLSIFTILLCGGFTGIAKAASPVLSVSPSNLTKNVGDSFDILAEINPSANKICAVEGTIVINNLTFKNITIAGDVTPQSAPTLSNYHFLIGIPGCTVSDRTLFTMSVKAENVGSSSVSFRDVDLIGAGTSAGSTSIGGNYTIQNIVVSNTIVPKTKIVAKIAPTSATTTITKPVVQQDNTITQTTPVSQSAAAINAVPAESNNISMWVWIIIGLIILGFVIYYIYKKRKI